MLSTFHLYSFSYNYHKKDSILHIILKMKSSFVGFPIACGINKTNRTPWFVLNWASQTHKRSTKAQPSCFGLGLIFLIPWDWFLETVQKFTILSIITALLGSSGCQTFSVMYVVFVSDTKKSNLSSKTEKYGRQDSWYGNSITLVEQCPSSVPVLHWLCENQSWMGSDWRYKRFWQATATRAILPGEAFLYSDHFRDLLFIS